jgi:hypothetical protein
MTEELLSRTQNAVLSLSERFVKLLHSCQQTLRCDLLLYTRNVVSIVLWRNNA